MERTSDKVLTSTSSRIPSCWRGPLLALGGTLLAIALLYWPTIRSMAETWWTIKTYSHGMVVPLISLYLIARQWPALSRMSPEPTPWGPALIALGGGLWLLATLATVNLGQALAVVGLIILSVAAILGPRIAWRLAFPLGFLFFAVPMGEFLVPPLMDLTASFSVKALQLTGIPVHLEGRYITIPSGDWEVARACSGIRYLLASLTLGTLYAYLSYRSLRKRLTFIVLSGIAPLVANGLRAYGIIMIGHLSGMSLAVGVDHIIYGWLFFGVVMGIMFYVGNFWRDAAPVPHRPEAAGTDAGPSCTEQHAAHRLLRLGAVNLAVLALPLLVTGAAARPSRVQLADISIPAAPAGWQLSAAPAPDWHPLFAGADKSLTGSYVSEAGDKVYYYAAFYLGQHQGAELISPQNRLFDPERWARVGEDRLDLELPPAGVFPVHERVLRSKDGGAKVLWNWYWIDGKVSTGVLGTKLYDALARLTRGYRGAAVIALSAASSEDPAQAREELRRLLASGTLAGGGGIAVADSHY